MKAIVCLAAGAATAALAGTASAAPCANLPGTTYVTGSSAAKPFIKGIATALASASPVTTTIIYKGQGSCTGVDAVFNNTPLTGTASYWDATGTEQTCDLATAGDIADVGISDVFSSSCAGFGNPPAGIGDFFGPNQVMNFVVPKASSQTLISAEAAYFVFGFGSQGMVMPWNNDQFIFIRSASSGTQSMLAAAINVPPAKWKGVSQSGSGALLTAVASSTLPESTIGILASDVADANRDKVKILAYQHFKQDCAWLPDSSSTAFDKINVRDGHYPLWGPLHFFAKVDANNTPIKPDAANFIGYFTGKVTPPAGVNLLDLEISAYTVPECAMKVKRTSELGPVSSYTPAKACGCYFEAKANGTAPASCKTCTKDADCTGSTTHCNYGYCEAN
jgi:ABC-type phosphate transport system substrate-binding protein